MNATEARLRIEPDHSFTFPVEQAWLNVLRERAFADREQWTPTAPDEISSRLTSVAEILSQACEQARTQYDEDRVVSPGALWFVENRRLLESVCKALDQQFEEIALAARRGVETGLTSIEAASSFLQASGLVFERQAVEAYFLAAQQDSPWALREVWSLKLALEFALLERLAAVADSISSQTSALAAGEDARLCFTSLIQLEQCDWKKIAEALSETERTLSREPAGVYRRMTFETRDRYRGAVASLAQRSSSTETEIAETAVALAADAMQAPAENKRAAERRSHVGYYLVDDGKRILEREVGYRPTLRERFIRHVLRRPTGYYLFAVEAITVCVLLLLVSGTAETDPSWIIALLLLLPCLDAATAIVNRLVTMFLPPRVPPKLDFSEGVPDDCKTLVAVPTLLLNELQADSMVDQLEIRFLANRDPNLLFALVTDAPDSDRETDEKDNLVDRCAERIRELNLRYAQEGPEPFLLLHRRRLYNESEKVWMGWERKRGKLLELNQLLLGVVDKFPVKVGPVDKLKDIRFVITLDADTQLPRDAAQRLVGAMAHPLNRPVIDPKKGIVTEGYGLIQPRIGVSVHSAGKSRLAAVFSGETGFDIYTRAVSETYQDLFGEGVFTGKGIYEVETFEKVLNDRFPTNALLSHDLIEGIHARAGLSSDVELIDDYPSRFAAYAKRKHRWVRGDWQILRWLFPRVPTGNGTKVRNPLSTISKWKIFDNLRRSLLDLAVFALLICGWLFLPGGPLFWTVAVLILFALPGYVQLAFGVPGLVHARHRLAELGRLLEAFAESQMHALLFLALLPYNTLVMLDAVVRTMRRVFITRTRLLEWQTAAEADMGVTRRGPIEKYLDASAYVGAGVALALSFIDPITLLVAGPLLVSWILVEPLVAWLDGSPGGPPPAKIPADDTFLRDAALMQWRFFAENSNESENWLIPDSVQEAPAAVVHKTSPTNLGLLLNAVMAALELGYIALPEAVDRIEAAMDSIESLERSRGHFLNWYDTRTLQPVAPFFISTVDNGNLVGCLWALKQGLLEYLERPVVSGAAKKGLADHCRALLAVIPGSTSEGQRGEQCRRLRMTIEKWDERSEQGDDPFLEMKGLVDAIVSNNLSHDGADALESDAWRQALADRIDSLRETTRDFAPWRNPAVRRKLARAGINLRDDVSSTSLARTQAVVESIAEEVIGHGGASDLSSTLRRSGWRASWLMQRVERLAARADALVSEMDFSLLFNRERKLLSVGYDASGETLERSCYDLLASEARMAVFAALAKGDVPQETWFRLGRAHVRVGDQCVLGSWTGTLFEYLMPLLWMRSYPNTLLDNSAYAAVQVQKKAAAKLGVPWGVSEAAYAACDEQGCYQYHAFGVPALALKETRALGKLPAWVSAPYALFLALQVDPKAALKELKELKQRGWSGRYGLYESIDFSGDRATGRPVMSWMAHHQGMSLVAACNVLAGYPFRRWFHAEPSVAAAELLLHERVPRQLALEAEERAA